MALSAAAKRTYGVETEQSQHPVKASAVIYEGSVVGRTSGYARALVAGDEFAGFALEPATGGASDGLIYVTVRRKGRINIAITSVAITDVGKVVYASDDGTFTLTQSTNSPVGRVASWIATGTCILSFDTHHPPRVTGITALTAASGTGDNTVADVGGSFSQTTLNNNFQDLAAKVNELIAILK